MNTLIVIPRAEYNYKAPDMPLGMYSVATYLKQHGHKVTVTDRSFDKTSPEEMIKKYSPDIVLLTVLSNRVANDAKKITEKFRAAGITVVWGAGFASIYSDIILKEGLCDYITMKEGEICTLNLLNALEKGEDPSLVRGIGMIKNGKPFYTPEEPPADLADLPVIDFSVYDPEKYIHRYISCKKMTYLYTGKGCPGCCTFCSHAPYNYYCYRVRPVEYVIEEIEYLIQNHGLDGVYFSDACWYVDKKNMYRFCSLLDERKIHIHWGCEVRIGIYNDEDLKYMYEHGCRWIFFGVETGDPDMMKKIKKGITLTQIKDNIFSCKKIGITSIASFIVGYPDETPEQLAATVNFAKELDPGIVSFAIFTPAVGSELCETLEKEGKYKTPDSFDRIKKLIVGEASSYKCNTIPQNELMVIKSCFLWESFTKKSTAEDTKRFEVATNSIKDAIDNLTRLGMRGIVPGIVLIAKQFIPVFYWSHSHKKIRKKYGL